MAILAWKRSLGMPESSKFAVCKREKNWRKLDAGTFSPIRGVIFNKGNIFTVHFSPVPMRNSGDGGGMMVSQRRLSSWIELFLAPSEYWWESMCCFPNQNKDLFISSSLSSYIFLYEWIIYFNNNIARCNSLLMQHIVTCPDSFALNFRYIFQNM